MFFSIFSFELKRWFKSWQLYLYILLFFGLGVFLMGSSIGFFDSVAVTSTSLTQMNSPLMISALLEGLNRLLYFLFPTIIGAAIYKDYKYRIYQIFYSYPFTKSSYLLGKFLSAFLVCLIISIFAGIGIYIATLLPWANPELIGPNHFWNYAQSYLINILPNMFLIGSIVFVITTLSRSVYVGFASVIGLTILMGVVNNLAADLDNEILAALIDPSGMQALEYYTQYWTIDEFNTSNLPVGKWYLINRLIWVVVALILIGIMAITFQFSEQGISLNFFRKKKSQRLVKPNFIGLYQITLPKITYGFTNKNHWNNILSFMRLDYKYIVRNKVFIILCVIGLLSLALIGALANQMYGTPTLPVTRNIVGMVNGVFEIFIIANTFLGAGLLIHRGKTSNMDGLIDVTPTPNWVFFTSKFFAVILMQLTLLLTMIIGGVLIQSYYGYFKFEFGLYFKNILGQQLFYYLIWAGLAMLVQTLFRNYIVGFFVLILFYLFGDKYSALGVEQAVFFFNKLPKPSYSDLNGFGAGLAKYYIYVLYWLLFTGFLSGLTILFWRRGVLTGIKERFYFVKKRAKLKLILPSIIFFIGFLSIGGYLYYENTILHTYYSSKDKELMQVEYEKRYKRYENMKLPRIVDVNADVDIFPKTRDFEVNGHYVLKNKHAVSLDSLLINFQSDYINEIEIEGAEFLSKDTINGFAFYKLNQPLDSGETIKMDFKLKNKPNSILRNNSPILNNGTFINNFLFPQLGYDADQEISNTQLREKYHLPPKERMAEQTDSLARQNTYISRDADWITFETTVSTDKDQIAIAPGYLQKEWTEGDRRYFHYSMGDQEILNFFAYNSGKYEVKRDQWKDIDLEIYYNDTHPYNVDRMMKSLKKSFDYYVSQYSPYQFEQARIIEFPVTEGNFAQSFANTFPFSEGVGFIANVDDEDPDAVDYPFSISSHELAHQWWAHQVIGANVQGSTMLSESLAEYSSLKVLEKEYGIGQMRKYLQNALDGYLSSRSQEQKKEKPLMYNENQGYIHYNKGSLVFYALSDYIGEENLNQTLSDYIDKVAFQEPPYTVSGELIEMLTEATPDSLQYLIEDMFESITLYDNYIQEAEAKELENGQYEISIKAIASKYKSGEKGNRIYSDKKGDSLLFVDDRKREISSLPLKDYIEIGVFGKNDEQEANKASEKILYLEKRKVTEIENDFIIIVDEKPTEVGIDPYNKLIDTRSYDNRKKVSFKKKP